MHGFDAFEVPTDEFICTQHILGVVIPDIQKPVILPAFCLLGCDAFGNLNIDFFILPGGNEVNFAIGGFSNVHRIAPAAQLQINYVL